MIIFVICLFSIPLFFLHFDEKIMVSMLGKKKY